jgi:hypothetical protein
MSITFTVDATELNRALKIVSIVTPQVQGGGGAGYLFVVKQSGTCNVYSRDLSKHEARTSFVISDVEGEGPFVLPAETVAELGHVKDAIKFTVTHEGSTFMVKYRFGSAGAEAITVDPRTMSVFEADIQNAKENVTPLEFPVKVLQYSLSTVKGFLPKPNESLENEALRTAKMFGPSEDPALSTGDGYLLASDGHAACFIQCTSFVGKGVNFPQVHLGLVESFLGKSEGMVSIYSTKSKYYVMNQNGDVLGWPKHDAEFKKFSYYGLSDDVVVSVEASAMVAQLNYVRSTLPKDKNKVRMSYDPENSTFVFHASHNEKKSTSLAIPSTKVDVNSEHLIKLFSGVKGNEVEFRVKVIPGSEKNPKGRFFIRTIDSFNMANDGTVIALIPNTTPDVNECIVTRFVPSVE